MAPRILSSGHVAPMSYVQRFSMYIAAVDVSLDPGSWDLVVALVSDHCRSNKQSRPQHGALCFGSKEDNRAVTPSISNYAIGSQKACD